MNSFRRVVFGGEGRYVGLEMERDGKGRVGISQGGERRRERKTMYFISSKQASIEFSLCLFSSYQGTRREILEPCSVG